MTSISQAANLKTLGSFCQHGSLFKTNIALMTFYNIRYSDWTERIILLLEYMQIMSQSLLLDAGLHNQISSNGHFFSKLVVLFFRIVDPSNLLAFKQADSLTTALLGIIFCLTLLKYILTIYIISGAVWNLKKFTFLVNTSRWAFKLQGRVLCFFTTSFCLKTILSVSSGEYFIHGMSKFAIILIASIIIGIEYTLSFLIELQFCYILPTKNFLSNKGPQIPLINIAQKFILQFIQLIRLSPLTATWLAGISNLIFGIVRNFHHYTKLPLYNLRALLYQGDLLCLAFSFNIIYLLQLVLNSAHYQQIDINFLIVVWIIGAGLMILVSRALLKHLLMGLLTGNKRGSPEMLVHKVIATRQLFKNERLPGKSSDTYDLTYLLGATQNMNINIIFGLNPESFESIVHSVSRTKDANKRLFIEYLEKLSAKFPSSSFVKLHFAYMCAKDSDLYTKSIKIVTELKQSRWSLYYITAFFLLYEIEKSLLTNSNSENNTLDLYTYIKTQIAVDELKKDMLKQVGLKIKICNNILKDTSNLGEMFDSAQIIGRSKEEIQKTIKILSQNLPEQYIDPLLLCAEYHLKVNFSVEDYQKYWDMYVQRYFKYRKYFRDLNLVEENLYQETNAFILLSGQKTDNGRILFCSKSIQDICGGEKTSYTGTHISSLFTPSFKLLYTNIFKQIFEIGRKSLINKVFKAYLYHKDGHIVETDVCVKVHPFLGDNLYLDMIIRPVPSSNEYILIKENGDIEGATQIIADILGLNMTFYSNAAPANIRLLSEELYKVNEAFNIVNKHEGIDNLAKNISHKLSIDKDKKAGSLTDESSSPLSYTSDSRKNRVSMDYGKALHLYCLYTSQGKHIGVTPIKQILDQRVNSVCRSRYIYHCNMANLSHESNNMRLITLQVDMREDAEEYAASLYDKFKRQETIINTNNHIEEESEGQEEKITEHTFRNESENIECEDNNNIEVVPYWKEENNLSTHGNLISLQTHRQTSRKFTLVPARSLEKPKIIITSEIKKVHFRSNIMVGINEPSKHENNQVNEIDMGNWSLSVNPSLETLRDSYVEKAFRRAITSKSYPKSFSVLCLVFYGVILGTLVSQIAIKVISDNTMSHLVQKKDLLKYAQLRTYKATYLQTNARGAANILIGALNVDKLGTASLNISTSIANLVSYYKDLSEYNKQIIDGIDSLEDYIKEQLFMKDIRIYGTYLDSLEDRYRNVTSFEVVDEIGNAVKALASLPNPATYKGYHTTNFLSKNILNDYLVKEDAITNLLIYSVEQERAYFKQIIVLCLIVTPLLLALIALILTLIFWNQYRIEKNQMLAFRKLNSDGVSYILTNLQNFKEVLINEERIENKKQNNFLKELTTKIGSSQDRNKKRQQQQIISYSDTRKRYFGYVLKVIFYIAVLIAAMIWNYTSAQKSTDVIYRRQEQLQFTNYMSTKIAISYVTFVELFSTNNTSPIQHIDPLTSFVGLIDDIKRIQSKITNILVDEDQNYDPEVQAILFQNVDCKVFDSNVNALRYCKSISGMGQPTNFLPVLAQYIVLMTDSYFNFLSANKTTSGTIMTSGYRTAGTILAAFGLLVAEAQIVGKSIDNNLRENINDANYQRSLILAASLFSLIVVSILIWFQILTKLREVHNDFKKVLQVFPSNLILSSSLLKTFLRNTSADVQAEYKNTSDSVSEK